MAVLLPDRPGRSGSDRLELAPCLSVPRGEPEGAARVKGESAFRTPVVQPQVDAPILEGHPGQGRGSPEEARL